jgi:UDP-glucose 4-epimerase
VPCAIVTGARGFIGRHVARSLAEKGWVVHGIGPSSWNDWRAWGIQEWRTAPVLFEALKDWELSPDILVHGAGAGSVGLSFADPAGHYNHAMTPALDSLEYLRRHAPAARFIYLSSAAVYGSQPAAPIAEDASGTPISPYGLAKRHGEELCDLYATQFGLTTVALRVFSAYGAGQAKQLLWDVCRKAAACDLTFGGSGEEVRDWIEVRDLADLVACLARADLPAKFTPVNGGTGAGVAVRDIITRLLLALGVTQAPAFSGVGRIGDPDVFIADMRRAFALGWTPRVGLDDGLADYAKWWHALDKAA